MIAETSVGEGLQIQAEFAVNEGSLAAFLFAAELGAKVVELDVRKTADGQLVVVHDAKISFGGKSYSIASTKLSALQLIDPNICTLREALDVISERGLEVMIELKVSGVEEDVLACVDACGMNGKAKYGCFTLSVINRIKALRPSAETIYLIQTKANLDAVVKDPGEYSASIISVSASILTASSVYRLHLGGKQVYVWTVNSQSEISLFKSMGVDGITTDYPDYV